MPRKWFRRAQIDLGQWAGLITDEQARWRRSRSTAESFCGELSRSALRTSSASEAEDTGAERQLRLPSRVQLTLKPLSVGGPLSDGRDRRHTHQLACGDFIIEGGKWEDA